MAADGHVFDHLTIKEKTAVMAVLSRDQRLRENEDERVTKLRIDLAKERRSGVLAASHDTSKLKRVCARCRSDVGLVNVERCPSCKHVICKKCQIYQYNRLWSTDDTRKRNEKADNTFDITTNGINKTGNSNETNISNGTTLPYETIVRNSSYPALRNPFNSHPSTNAPLVGIDIDDRLNTTSTTMARNSSYPNRLNPFTQCNIVRVSSYPAELNPFEQSLNKNTREEKSGTINLLDVETSESGLPDMLTVECEVIDDDVPIASTPRYDTQLGRSLVGGDIELPENLGSNLVEHYKFPNRATSKSFSHSNNLHRRRLDFSRRKSVEYTSHDKLNDTINVSNTTPAILIEKPLASYESLPTSHHQDVGSSASLHSPVNDSGDIVHSDSSAPISTISSRLGVTAETGQGMGRRSRSTGHLPSTFDEKEAVSFLLEIAATGKTSGTGSIQERETPSSNSEISENEDLSAVEVCQIKQEENATNMDDDISKQDDIDVPKLTLHDSSKSQNIFKLMSTTFSAFETLATDLRKKKTTETKSFQITKPSIFNISNNTAADVTEHLKNILSLNKSSLQNKIDTNVSQKNTRNAAMLFKMATSQPKLDKTDVDEDIAIPVEHHDEAVQADLMKPSLEVTAPDHSISTVIGSEDTPEHVPANRLSRSNPSSPYRRKKLFSTNTDDGAECSIASESELRSRHDSSSTNAPSTSSSEEGYYRYPSYRRKNRFAEPRKYEAGPNAPTVVKDSGYSTHENYLKSRNRSKYMRATRLSRRAREKERCLRRLGRKSTRGRYQPTKERELSSELSDSTNSNFVSRPRSTTLPHITLQVETRLNHVEEAQSDGDIAIPIVSTNSLKKLSQNFDHNANISKLSSSARRPSFLDRFAAKIKLNHNRETNWLCKVCDKTIDVKKKSGDWFYANTRPEVLHFKELLLNTNKRLSFDLPVVSLSSSMIDEKRTQPSPLVIQENPSSLRMNSLQTPRLTRLRSNTLPSDMYRLDGNTSLHKSPSLTSLTEDNSVDSSQMTANMQRQRLRIRRKTVSEVLHGTLLYELPDLQSAGSKPQFVKKQTSVTEPVLPACIRAGPEDTVIFKGNPVSLCCNLGGTPPLKSIWRKGKNELKSSSQCSLDLTNITAALTIRNSEKDDSGCYTLQVKNAGGVDQYSVNVSVVDVPDPPGKPYATDISATTLVLSWYGTGYDGGSTIASYQVEMAEENVKPKKWKVVTSTKNTSCTVKDVVPNSKYIFRVCAANKYGTSSPGEISDVVVNTVTEVVDSSEDEESFVRYGAVVVKTDGTFSQKYETKERLGQGRFGKVHRVVDRHNGKQYAAKIMRALKAKDKEAVQQEIDIMNSLHHPRLVQLIDAFSHGREITMVMDIVSGGELFERVIDEDFELTEAACIKYMSQICEGLKYMHDTLILHLDLKPENIMCINKTGTQVKIIDFGLARRYNPKEIIRVMFGTPEFVAPEVINYDAIGPQTDMWSVGVICYILLSGLSPFMGDNDSETLSNITAAEWDFEDEAFDEISHEAKDFIKQLLVKNLNKRYTVHKALEHKWLKKDTNKMKKSKLNTKNLKRFLARRKWQKTGNAVRALGRLASLANLGSPSANANKISNGQPGKSGFLSALKAQLLRENEEEQEMHNNCKPMFDTLFDDVEVIEGSAAKFECTIIGTPDPEIMWYKDGEPIKESRRFRISYTEDDVCKLLITDTTENDEAEYTCKAVNCEGETEHRAELIVITPGV